MPAMEAMHRTWGDASLPAVRLPRRLQPDADASTTKLQPATIVPGVGWFDVDYLGIDQGPIVAMIENHRSGLVWKTMRKNPHIVRGLQTRGVHGRVAWRSGELQNASGCRRAVSRCSPLAVRLHRRLTRSCNKPATTSHRVLGPRPRGRGRRRAPSAISSASNPASTSTSSRSPGPRRTRSC